MDKLNEKEKRITEIALDLLRDRVARFTGSITEEQLRDIHELKMKLLS